MESSNSKYIGIESRQIHCAQIADGEVHCTQIADGEIHCTQIAEGEIDKLIAIAGDEQR